VGLYDDPLIGEELSCSIWYTTFCWCHSMTENGIMFHGWPNGECLDNQEMMTLQIMSCIKDEVIAQVKRKAKGIGHSGR
jgi:hypothetical protein